MPAITSEIATGLRRWRGSGEAGFPIPAFVAGFPDSGNLQCSWLLFFCVNPETNHHKAVNIRPGHGEGEDQLLLSQGNP
jgi:hypothetical protein